MKKTFSKFVRQFEYDNEVALFNSYNKSLVLIKKEYIDNDMLNESFPNEYLETLDKMDYFIDDDSADKLIRKALEKDKKLILSVEVSLGCNMRCPYCYQGAEKKTSVLPDGCIDDLVEYCNLVEKNYEYEEIVLKVLGGEPTIIWEKTKRVIDEVMDYCHIRNKKFSLMIDTNGVMVDDILELNGYDSLLLTIPLTYKRCHDKMRKLVNGQGSYEIIVSNLMKIHDRNPDIRVVLRHNTDDENIRFFGNYVSDLRTTLDYNPIIDISYTTEMGDEPYKNGLDYEEYVRWKSTEAIDILTENDCNIVATPLMSTDRCQHRSAYSLKLFSDGTIGSCAMWFYNKDRIKLRDLCDDISLIENIKNEDIHLYEKCSTCRSFFLCGGGYNLPCINSLEIKACQADGEYILNLESFVRRYIKYKKDGKEALFIGFNNKLVIR